MKIKKITFHNKNKVKPMWDLEVPEFHRYVLSNGIMSHNSISHTFQEPCISTGVEPAIFPFGWKRTRFNTKSYNKWEFYFIIYEDIKNFILEKLKEKNLEETDDFKFLKDLPTSVLDNDGKIGLRVKSIVEKYIDNLPIKSAYEIDPFKKVMLMAAMQKWVDASISNTYLLNRNFSKKDLNKLLRFAHKSGLKSMTVYREGSREEIYTTLDPITFNKIYKKDKKDICLKRPEDIIYNCSPKRPEVLKCDIHHCIVNGKPWIVLVGLLNNKPYEIFAGEYDKEIMHVPKKLKSGYIRKVKKSKNIQSKYNLEIEIRNSKVVYENISELFMNEEHRALTRLISTSLRHGVYPRFLIEQLKKSSDFVTDFMSVVSRVLSKYKINKHDVFIDSKREIKCPMCDSPMINDGGCMKCSNEKCGYSKCD